MAFAKNKLGLISTNGEHDHCFDMYDIHFFDDADAIVFKLTFPEVVFTDEEVALSNTQDDLHPSADKSRLWENKMSIYNMME